MGTCSEDTHTDEDQSPDGRDHTGVQTAWVVRRMEDQLWKARTCQLKGHVNTSSHYGATRPQSFSKANREGQKGESQHTIGEGGRGLAERPPSFLGCGEAGSWKLHLSRKQKAQGREGT